MKALSPQQITQLQNKFAAAQQARQSGLHLQAENLFRDILKMAPEAWDVQQQLALLLATTGRAKEAIKHFRLIVKANPAYAPGHANLASALSEAGEKREAVTEFKRALALDSKLVGAHIALAATLRQDGKPLEAIPHYKAALDLDKVNHAAFNGLGLAYRDTDDLPRALEGLEHAVGIAPENAEYRLNFGVTLRKYELLDFAAEQFYEAVSLKPDWLEAVVFLAEVLQEQHRYDEARECYDRALQLKPGDPELFERLGFVYLEMGDTGHALGEFDKVLQGYPNRSVALLGKGRSYMDSGDSVAAAAALESLITHYPDEAGGYFYLATSRKFVQGDPLIQKIKALANRLSGEDWAVGALNFALGKIYDDCKDWDAAFEYYARGNQIRDREYDYQPADEEAKFDRLISVFNSEFISRHRHLGVDSKLPILIVGMPRSGTTLTEQIISSHPQVIGAGEVDFWGKANTVIPYMLGTSQDYPECMGLMTQTVAGEIAAKYTALLHKIVGSGNNPEHITDKMPHNFLRLGLIALLFPNMPIIHCKRDALDNCLSIFFQNFGGDHPYAYDLDHLGHHHRQYERLMAHWHAMFPGRILDINYEDTIADPEYWSRKLIEHVGLEWDDACLAPHKLERTVKTASHWQVRQPIYKTSVQRWKNYEKHLGPLKAALGYQD